MPTVLRIGPYKFFFYSNNGDEPQHVHISRDNKIAKFWIDPVRLQVSGGFSRHELLKIQNLVHEHQSQLVENWNEFFNG